MPKKRTSTYWPEEGDKTLRLIPNPDGPGFVGWAFTEPKNAEGKGPYTRRQMFGGVILSDRAAYLQMDKQLNLNRDVADEGNAVTFMALFDGWCGKSPKRGKGSTAYYIGERLRRYFEDDPVTVITDEKLIELVQDRLDDGYAQTTIAVEISHLFCALNRGAKQSLLPKGYKIPEDFERPKAQSRHTYLKRKNEERLWAECRAIVMAGVEDWRRDGSRPLNRWRCALFCLLALATGCRLEAGTELEWDQIEWDGGDDQSGLIWLNQDGRDQTRKHRSTVPMQRRLRPILEWVRDNMQRSSLVLLNDRSLQHAIPLFIAGLGIKCADPERRGEHRCSAHDLRRTFATLLVQAGVSLQNVADLLGDSIEVTREHYAQFEPGASHAIAAINARHEDEDEKEPEPA